MLREIEAYSKSRLFIYFLLSCCFFIAIGQLAHSIDVYYEKIWEIQFRRILDAMFLSLPILFGKKKWVVLGWLLLANLYLLSIIWYYRTYATIMPLSSYLMFDNLKGLENSILHSIHLKDSLIVLPSLLFSLFYLYVFQEEKSLKTHYKIYLLLVLFGLLSIPYWPNKRPFYEQPLYLYKIVNSRAFKEYGVINFWIYQTSLWGNVSEEEKRYACEFMDRLREEQPLVSSNLITKEPKNLILILVESLQSWAIDKIQNNIEITPCINKLVKMPETVYIPRVLPQVKDGRSSDAQLLINTGLLPLNAGAASSLYATNTYPSLADALKGKGYVSASFICDEKDFWNQGTTTIAYGFDHLFDRLQGGKAKQEADKLLFDSSISYLKGLKKPFYAQLVTISMHEPYTKPQVDNSSLLREHFQNDEVRNYLIALQLLDMRIAYFLDRLKKENLYDNSMIVIVGDHEQMTYNQYENRAQLEASDCFIPFIILNSSLDSKHTDEIMGQVDIYPSLLHLMGCTGYRFKGLGDDIFGDSISNYATNRTGIAAGGTNVSDSVQNYREELWNVSDILLRMNYFK